MSSFLSRRRSAKSKSAARQPPLWRQASRLPLRAASCHRELRLRFPSLLKPRRIIRRAGRPALRQARCLPPRPTPRVHRKSQIAKREMELKFILEAVLFSAQKPLSPAELRDVLADAAEQAEEETARLFKKVKLDELNAALEQLAREHDGAKRSYRLVCVAGSWQFVSQPEYAPWLKALVGHRLRPPRLSQPALETLAIIAYRQPLTRAEIEQIRGVSVDGVMQTLLQRGLIEQVGRAEVVGRPMTYGTTGVFLEYFGLRSLEDLPAADELRKVIVQKPESLLTVEPGLATAPPEQLTLDAAKDGTAGGPEQKPQAESRKSETRVQETAPDVAPGNEAVRPPRS